MVCAGCYCEVFGSQAACVMRNEGQTNLVVANVNIRVMDGFLGQISYLVDKCNGGSKGLELEGSHQFAAFDFPTGAGTQVGSDLSVGKYGHGCSREDKLVILIK